MKKSAFATVVLSAVPGAGHLYLGWQERGIKLMLTFFLLWFLVDALQLSLFLFLMPVAWFYSFFDALQCFSKEEESPQGQPSYFNWLIEKQRWVGIGLIALGVIILFQRTVMPLLRIYLDYRVLSTITPALTALLFICGGLWLAFGKKLPASAAQELPPAPGPEQEGGE